MTWGFSKKISDKKNYRKWIIRSGLIIVGGIVFVKFLGVSKNPNIKENLKTNVILVISDDFSIRERDINYILKSNKSISRETAYQIALSVYKYSKMFNLDPQLVLKIIKVESSFDPYAVSKKGAKGLMQIMPETFEMASNYLKMLKRDFDIFNIEDNILVGCFYLRLLIDYSDGNIDIALRKYYAGHYWDSKITVSYLNKIKKEIVE